MVLSGTVLGVERREGVSEATPDRPASKWAFVQAHVLDGVTVHKVRLADDFPLPLPIAGEVCDLAVEVSAYRSRGGAEVSIRALRRAEGEPVAPARAAG